MESKECLRHQDSFRSFWGQVRSTRCLISLLEIAGGQQAPRQKKRQRYRSRTGFYAGNRSFWEIFLFLIILPLWQVDFLMGIMNLLIWRIRTILFILTRPVHQYVFANLFSNTAHTFTDSDCFSAAKAFGANPYLGSCNRNDHN